jgi:hypothetical protein
MGFGQSGKSDLLQIVLSDLIYVLILRNYYK